MIICHINKQWKKKPNKNGCANNILFLFIFLSSYIMPKFSSNNL